LTFINAVGSKTRISKTRQHHTMKSVGYCTDFIISEPIMVRAWRNL